MVMYILEKLKELEVKSVERGIPILGSEKGQWLLGKVEEVKPQHILELGTANGYSGCILGSIGGKLITLEQDVQIAGEAVQNFGKYGVRADVMVGDGVERVHKLAAQAENQGKFDIIFIDFSKKNYLPVLEDCITLCKQGGLIIADNITFSGCQDFKEAVLADERLETEIIDIRDGLSCSRKL
jgi:predicted O-methyltransferase YrrM